MKVYKKLAKGEYHATVAKNAKISETHTARIASFLVKEYFLYPTSPEDVIRLYSKTKRIPTLKILYELLKERKRKDGGSSLCELQKLQYRCELKGEVTDRVINWCKPITPKGTKKYIFPPNKKFKFGFTATIHDGKNKKSVMIYPDRIHLTVDEMEYSDEIIVERIKRIAYDIQYLFKIQLGMPTPVGREKEYAFVPKEKFLLDALEEATFDYESPIGIVKADKSGDKKFLDGKQIEFDNKDLAKTYLKLIPTVQMIGNITLDNKARIEQIEQEILPSILQKINTILKETLSVKNMLDPKFAPDDLDNPSYG